MGSFSQQTSPSFPSPQTSLYPYMQYPLPSLPLFPWLDTQDLRPESFGHLLLGGLAGKEGMNSCTPSLQTTSTADDNMVGFKEGSLACGYGYSSGNEEIHESVQTWNSSLPVSSPRSCVTDFSGDILDFSNTKMEGRHPKPDHSYECNSNGATTSSKKARVQSSLWAQSTFKVRKEKLGDRITALHQLVSPFGKTDTASVLSEAYGYIKFLHTQIQALSSPYLDNAPSNPRSSHLDVGNESEKDLRNRGLCLVPASCIMVVENNNITDHWSPAMLFR